MTGRSKDDNDRDVISLSTSARIRRSELDALESEVLIALEKALEATIQADNAPTLAPLQPEQPQLDDWKTDRRSQETPQNDDLPHDHAHEESSGADTAVAHSPEPARFQPSSVEPLGPEWSGPDRATRIRMPVEVVRPEWPQGERWRNERPRAEIDSSESTPIAGLRRKRDAGHVLPAMGPDEQGRREDFIRVLRERQRSTAHDMTLQPKPQRWPVVAIVGRLALAIAIAGAVAFSVFQFLSANLQTEGLSTGTPADATLWTRLLGAAQNEQPASQPARRLVLTALSGAANRPIALGVNVEGAPPGAFVLIKGLPSGGRITAGAALGEGVWRVSVRDLARAAVVPPADYVGAMDLPIDLSLADGTVADSDVLRLEWMPTVVQAVTPTPVKTTSVISTDNAFPPPERLSIPQAAPPISGKSEVESDAARVVSRQLDPEELGKLLQRGEDYLQNGDIAAARLLLRRAAEAGDLQATIALAATYDPMILQQLGALGASADVDKARAWYRKASELGSAEARLRLQRLTQEAR